MPIEAPAAGAARSVSAPAHGVELAPDRRGETTDPVALRCCRGGRDPNRRRGSKVREIENKRASKALEPIRRDTRPTIGPAMGTFVVMEAVLQHRVRVPRLQHHFALADCDAINRDPKPAVVGGANDVFRRPHAARRNRNVPSPRWDGEAIDQVLHHLWPDHGVVDHQMQVRVGRLLKAE